MLIRAELDMTDCDGKTALHLSCSEGHYDVVVQLLRAGANVNLVNLQVSTLHKHMCQTIISVIFVSFILVPMQCRAERRFASLCLREVSTSPASFLTMPLTLTTWTLTAGIFSFEICLMILILDIKHRRKYFMNSFA